MMKFEFRNSDYASGNYCMTHIQKLNEDSLVPWRFQYLFNSLLFITCWTYCQLTSVTYHNKNCKFFCLTMSINNIKRLPKISLNIPKKFMFIDLVTLCNYYARKFEMLFLFKIGNFEWDMTMLSLLMVKKCALFRYNFMKTNRWWYSYSKWDNCIWREDMRIE